MIYREVVEIEKITLDRWNFLLSKDFDDMTDEEMEKYNAKPYDSEGGFYVEFRDGSNVTIDLASGDTNYYDDVVWHSADNNTDIVFDCSYGIGKKTDELTVNNDSYIIEWKIVA